MQIHERLEDPFQPEKDQEFVRSAKDQRNAPIQPSLNQAAVDVERVHSVLDVQNSDDHDPRPRILGEGFKTIRSDPLVRVCLTGLSLSQPLHPTGSPGRRQVAATGLPR